MTMTLWCEVVRDKTVESKGRRKDERYRETRRRLRSDRIERACVLYVCTLKRIGIRNNNSKKKEEERTE